ncbi:methyltransferase domain-containing protein [Candidatus Pacearchaeota archaeon]|nr:methyltransferase domain-containing protein [Candidatus Pacearchaeota archaeon]
MKFLNAFIEDCRYYDLNKVELKNILKYVNVRNKTVLDVGAGIGRLAFPLSKYAKEVIALDNGKRFMPYFKKHKKTNVKFVNKSMEEYVKKTLKKFDIVLLAWPTFDFKMINSVKSSMNKDSKLIFITCDNNSDYETIPNKLRVLEKAVFNKDVQNKGKILKKLPKMFRVMVNRKLKTNYKYPDKKTAFRIIKNGLKLWFNIKLDKSNKVNLIALINKHKKGNKIIFEEKLYFYVLELK